MFTLGLGTEYSPSCSFHALATSIPRECVVSNQRYDSLADFPFQPLGFFALLILFLMAATSHDFWLHNLSAAVWKRSHAGQRCAARNHGCRRHQKQNQQREKAKRLERKSQGCRTADC